MKRLTLLALLFTGCAHVQASTPTEPCQAEDKAAQDAYYETMKANDPKIVERALNVYKLCWEAAHPRRS